MIKPLDGVVLAGGRSRRLGQDKALLRFGGVPLLSIVVERVARVCARVVVATDQTGRYQRLGLLAEFAADESPGNGPLSGLQSGLRACGTEHALVVACDLPFLNVKLLRYMADLPRSYQALVPWSGGLWQPLHSVYARSCLEAVDDILAGGGGSVHDLLERLDVRRLDEREMRRLDPDGYGFLNLNRPADLTRARSIWSQLERQEAPLE